MSHAQQRVSLLFPQLLQKRIISLVGFPEKKFRKQLPGSWLQQQHRFDDMQNYRKIEDQRVPRSPGVPRTFAPLRSVALRNSNCQIRAINEKYQ